jgi:hypothetical protein
MIILGLGIAAALIVLLIGLSKKEQDGLPEWASGVCDEGWELNRSLLGDQYVQGALEGHPVMFSNGARGSGVYGYCLLLRDVRHPVYVNRQKAWGDFLISPGHLQQIRQIPDLVSLDFLKPYSRVAVLGRPVPFLTRSGICLVREKRVQDWTPDEFKSHLQLMVELAKAYSRKLDAGG